MGRDFHRIEFCLDPPLWQFWKVFCLTHWGFPKWKQRELVCLLTAHVLFGSFAEGEEEWAVETSSRSINKKEVTLPTICVPHARPPDSHWRSSARGSGAWAVLPLQSRQSRLLPYREWNARSHGAGASAQENRLLGFEFFHPFTCQATPLFHGSYTARAQAFAPGKVSCVYPEVACIHREQLEEGWKFNLLKGCCSFGVLWIGCMWLSCLLGRQGLHASLPIENHVVHHAGLKTCLRAPVHDTAQPWSKCGEQHCFLSPNGVNAVGKCHILNGIPVF